MFKIAIIIVTVRQALLVRIAKTLYTQIHVYQIRVLTVEPA